MNKSFAVWVSLGLLASGSAWSASDDESVIRSHKYGFMANMDLDHGGDEIVKVRYTDGSTQTMRGGSGVEFGVGMHFRPLDSSFDIATSVAYKVDNTSAEDNNISMSRFVLKAIAQYDPKGTWWVGVGPAWHTNVKFKGNSFVRSAKFDDALGLNAQVGWKWIAVTYTKIDYKINTVTFDGSAIGLSLLYRY